MNQDDKDYERQMLEMAINNQLNEITSVTEESLKHLQTERDQIVWQIATRIYSQSGHKVEFSLVKNIVDIRIKTICSEIQKIQDTEIKETARKRLANFLNLEYSPYSSFLMSELDYFLSIRNLVAEFTGIEEATILLNYPLPDSKEFISKLEDEFYPVSDHEEFRRNVKTVKDAIKYFESLSWSQLLDEDDELKD